jgi:ATP-dependent helicase/nuclease subunit B
MTRTAPRIATFVGETFFVDALAAHIVDIYEDANDPAALSHITLCVPTRRAVQSVKEALIALRPHGLFLPRILTIAELTPLHVLPADAALWHNTPPTLIDSTRRLLYVIDILIQFSHQESYKDIFATPLTVQDALHYATSFLSLRDDFKRASVCYHHIDDTIIGDYAAHWEQTLRVFRALMTQMDAYILENNLQESLPNQLAQMQDIAHYWQHTPHPHPFIIAGSTGSTPSTVALMQAVYHLPQGSILLPALDMWMDEATFAQIAPTHAQYHLQHLLNALQLTRADVVQLQAGNSERGLLAATMLRPHNDTGYPPLTNNTDNQHIAYVECDDDIMETEAIALHIRHLLHRGATQIIVISDDDAFNIRLQSLLATHHIATDISAGVALAHESAHHFMLLVAELLNTPYHSVTLLATLRHICCSSDSKATTALAAFLDSRIVRGMHPFTALPSLLRHLQHQPSVPEEAFPAISLLQSLLPLIHAPYHTQPITELITHHLHALSLIGDDGLLAEPRAFLNTLLAAMPPHLRCNAADYPRFLWEQCASKRAGLPPTHAPVHILGALELRLQRADALIVPRMNEGVFPAKIPADPWLGNAMRRQLGLNYQERKIGLTAHDISMMLRFPQVLFTRALRENGCHTHASRFFERLKLLAAHTPLTHATHLLQWVKTYRSHLQEILPPFTPPSPPCPPLEVRPHSLSATMCESLLQHPFKVYASHICGLRTRDPLDDDLNAAYFGQALHRALHYATAHYQPDDLTAYHATLQRAFDKELASLVPENTAQFHRARLQRILQNFTEEEQQRAPFICHIASEQTHRAPFTLSGGTQIELTARIDRIEHRRDGSVHIIDHKTGVPPSLAEVKSLRSCQLLVAGLVVQPASIAALEYFDLRGKVQEQGSISSVLYQKDDPKLAWIAWDKMQEELLAALSPFIEDANTIYDYRSKRALKGYDALAHLARVGEWC